MAQAAMAAVPEVADVTILAPNLHNIPFNFAQLIKQGVKGLDGKPLQPVDAHSKPDTFIATTEPHGIIHLTVRRDDN